MTRFFIFLAFIIAYSSPSFGQLFKLTVSNSGTLTSSEVAILESALRGVETKINKNFPSADTPNRLLKGMANSSVMSGKGIGSNYASNMDVFLVGAGVGVGADMEKNAQLDSDISGIGLQGGLVIGTRLNWLDAEKILGLETNKLSLSFNFMRFNYDTNLGKNNKDSLEAKLGSFGFHARYDLISGSGTKWLGWGGIKVHTGYEYNKTKLTFGTKISETIGQDVGGGNTVSGTIQGEPEATIDVATHSIPIEISTDVQLAYFLSLYTGLGVDLNFGKAKGSGSLNAQETTLDLNSAPSGIKVQAEGNIDGSGSVNSFTSRTFLGVQLNLPFTNIYAQVDKALGNKLIGATLGARFVY